MRASPSSAKEWKNGAAHRSTTTDKLLGKPRIGQQVILAVLFAVLIFAGSSYAKPADLDTIANNGITGTRVDDLTCTMYQKCTTFGPSEGHPFGHENHSWVCKVTDEDGETYNGKFFDLVESPLLSKILQSTDPVVTSASTLTFSEAILDTKTGLLFVLETTRVGVWADAVRTLESHIDSQVAKTGTLRALVVRVIDRSGSQPTSDATKLVNDVFEDAVCLKSQMEACSYGKLTIEPFVGNTPDNKKFVSNGIVDVQLDFNIPYEDPSSFLPQVSLQHNAIIAATIDQIGDIDSDPMIDIVMFCYDAKVPLDEIFATAFVGGKYSFYNNEVCGYVAAQMHEVGHNLGLGHSGDLSYDEYGDSTGYMTISITRDDWKQCYNPHKSYQLGWYEDQVASINPLDGEDRRSFTLNGVSDYGRNEGNLVVLRLVQTDREQDYFVGYNRAVGMNANTIEDKNYVTVVRDEDRPGGPSTKLASLWPGRHMVIDDFNGSGKTIQVAFTGIDDDGNARIMVLEGTDPPPPPSPPEPCQKVTVVVVTNGCPKENSWHIKETEGLGYVSAASDPFVDPNTEYRQEVCLPRGTENKTYQFAIENTAGVFRCYSGIDDSVGYRVFDESGTELFSGGKDFSEEQQWNYHSIEVPLSNETPSPRSSKSQKKTKKKQKKNKKNKGRRLQRVRNTRIRRV